MNAQNCIKELKQKLMEKLDIMECFAEDRMFFIKHSKNKMLVGVEMFDYSAQDKYFYLYDSQDILNTDIDNFYQPVAMIKFMPNQYSKDEMFIRRLEFINDDYRGKGYASCLMKVFESYCEKNGYKIIGGELIPLHDIPENIVENYYVKNGFDILQSNGQKLIYKKVEKPIQATVEGVTFVENEYYTKQIKSQQPENINSL